MSHSQDITEHPSRGKYREAYQRYCDEPEMPSLAKLANEIGIHPETLTIYAHRHNWTQQRITTQAHKQVAIKGSRQQIAAEMDEFITKKVQSFSQQMAEQLDRTMQVLAKLPLEVRDAAGDLMEGDTRRSMKSSVDIMQGAQKVLADMVETGRSIGLVIGPTKTEGEKQKLDLGKLTTLNLILNEARKPQGMAKAAEERGEAIDVTPSQGETW